MRAAFRFAGSVFSKYSRYPHWPEARVTASVFVLLLGTFAVTTRAEETLPDNIGPDSHALPEPDETHPIYSTNAHWVESMAIAAAALFVAAAVIGPIVRAEAPDAVPAAISHEEDPSADRH